MDYGCFSEQDAMTYINFLLNITLDNLSSINIYDYEKIIYFEIIYPDNNSLQEAIIQLKNKIAQNFIFKQKLLKRYGR
jgi:hypothetical protein